MKQIFINQWLKGFALVALMLTSSMVANATFYLVGDYTNDGSGWAASSENEMKELSRGKYYIDLTVDEGFMFHVKYKNGGDYEQDYGFYTDNSDVTSIPKYVEMSTNGLPHLRMMVKGTFRFIYDSEGFDFFIREVPMPVEVATDLVGGTITAYQTEAAAGEMVSITVRPDYGYVATSADVSIELTANPGSAQAPHHAPQVGEIIHPEGDAQATHDAPASYFFVMPERPYGVYISANFQELDRHKIVIYNRPYCTVTTDQPDNNAVPVGAVVTLTAQVAADDLFTPSILVNSQLGVAPSFWQVLENDGTNTFTFTMPELDVEVRPGLQTYLQGVVFDDERHWATYYGAYNVIVPEGITAYVVTGVENNEVQVQEIAPQNGYFIPKNTGALLYSETPMSDIAVGVHDEDTETPDLGSNLLQGSVEDIEVSSGYVLVNDTFYRSQVGTLPAHRCYLPASAVPAGAPRMLKINRPGEGGVVTGVETISTNDVVNVKYVNMSGMTSDKPFDGVNVKVITRADGTTETSKIIK